MFQPAQGSLILGRYLLEHELERGGMSFVWLAADLKLQRSVAVKLLQTTMGASYEARLRFEREAMAVAQLQSPHVVQIFDYGVEHDAPIIVMERLYGEDLRTRLKREQRLPLDQVGKVVLETAKGLSEAHAAGIIHRDLKPGNIFFARTREDEVVKLLDFGVAKMDGSALSSSPASGSLVGTPHYMSPEQARGSEDIDHRSDLWSLGVIIYHALTGRLPYGGNNTADVLAKISTHRFAPPSAVCPDLPPELDEFMRYAMAREPNQRFNSAREMAAAFSRIVPVSMPALEMPEPRVVDDEKTVEFDPLQEMQMMGELPPPPPLPREFAQPAIPNEAPSFPSHPSTIGGAMIDYARPSPAKRFIIWSLASLLVAGGAVAAAFFAYRPTTSDAPPAPTEEPIAAAPQQPPTPEEEEEDTTEAAPAPKQKAAPAPAPVSEEPKPRSKSTPTPTRVSHNTSDSKPQPRPAQPVPVPKPKETTEPAKSTPKEIDYSRSRF